MGRAAVVGRLRAGEHQALAVRQPLGLSSMTRVFNASVKPEDVQFGGSQMPGAKGNHLAARGHPGTPGILGQKAACASLADNQSSSVLIVRDANHVVRIQQP